MLARRGPVDPRHLSRGRLDARKSIRHDHDPKYIDEGINGQNESIEYPLETCAKALLEDAAWEFSQGFEVRLQLQYRDYAPHRIVVCETIIAQTHNELEAALSVFVGDVRAHMARSYPGNTLETFWASWALGDLGLSGVAIE